jgi:N-acetylmuramoyl-L-alanine amidase
MNPLQKCMIAVLACLTLVVPVGAVEVTTPAGSFALREKSFGETAWVCAEELAAALHAGFGQDPVSNYPSLTLRGHRVLISTASVVVSVDGKIHKLQHVPVVKEGCLWLPTEFLTQVLPQVLGGPVTLAAGGEPGPPKAPVPGAASPKAPAPISGTAVSFDVAVSADSVRLTLTGGAAPSAEVKQADRTLQIALPTGTFAGAPKEVGQGIAERVEVEKGGQRLLVRLGPGFRQAEALKLKNPDRLVVLLKGEGQVVSSPPPEAPAGPERPAAPETAAPSEASAPPKKTPAFDVVVLDPGHGGSDTGAIAASGIQEKDLTLAIAQKLAAELEKQGLKAILTRTTDVSVPLTQRTALANFNQADLVVSIHLNSSPSKSVKGAETYYLSQQATDLWASQLAQRENYETGEEVTPKGELNLVLWELAQVSHIRESAGLAETVQQEFNGLLGTKDRGVRQAPFIVLEGAQMPAVLVEVAFLSNALEAKRLADSVFQDQAAVALAKAILDFKVRYENPNAAPPQ